MDLFEASRPMFIPKKKEKEYYKKFMRLKSFEERIKLTMKLFEENDMINKFNSVIKVYKKDAAISTNFRNMANQLYTTPIDPSAKKKIDWNNMIMMFSDSIRYAPAQSLESALGYANRSVMLFKVRLYRDCLKDIERALNNSNYPNDQRAELYVRKAQCLVILDSSTSEIKDALEQARKWLKEMEIENTRKMIEDIINFPIIKNSFPRQREFYDCDKSIPIIPDDNPEIIGASSAVELKYSEEFGRHLVATRSIDPGEIIAIQKCFASMISIGRHLDFCFNCRRQTWSGIPCDSCILVIYCSEECRAQAWSDHHQLECQIIDLIVAFAPRDVESINIKVFVKAFKQAGSIEAFKKNIEMVNSNEDLRTKGFVDNVFDGEQYAAFYSLPSFAEKRTYNEVIEAAISATFVTYLLATKTDIFGTKLDSNLTTLRENDMFTFIGGLLMRQQLQIGVNCGLVSGNVSDNDLVCYFAYPFNKLFLHSCVANIAISSRRNYSIIYSVECIKKGDLLYYDNGCNFLTVPKLMRLKGLREEFSIDCKCQACKENWPRTNGLPFLFDEDLPTDVLIKLEENYKKFSEKAIFYSNNKNYELKPEDYAEVGKLIKMFHESYPHPTREKYQVIGVLKSLYDANECRAQRIDD